MATQNVLICAFVYAIRVMFVNRVKIQDLFFMAILRKNKKIETKEREKQKSPLSSNAK